MKHCECVVNVEPGVCYPRDYPFQRCGAPAEIAVPEWDDYGNPIEHWMCWEHRAAILWRLHISKNELDKVFQ
jgi:hypothetical protein